MDTVSGCEPLANALTGSAMLLQTLLTQSTDMITVSDRDGTIIYVNPAAARVTGYDAAELLTQPPFTSIYLEDRPHYQAAHDQLLQTPTSSLELRYRIKHRDGSWHWVEGTLTNMLHDPAVNGLVALMHDMTLHTRAEHALTISEERYRMLFEAIDDGFCTIEIILDTNGKPVDYRFLDVNPAFEQHSGLVNVQGRTARELVPTLEDYWFETYGNVALTGEPIRLEQYSEPMGRWFDVYTFRIGTPKERKVAVWFKDVTERKQAENALSITEERYHTLFQAIDEGFCLIEVVFDANGKAVDYIFLEVNPAFEHQTGLVDTIGRRMRDLVPDQEQYWFDIYGQVVTTGQPFRFDQGAKALNRWYDVYAFRIGEQHEHKVAVLFRDVSQRKRMEEALRVSEQRFRAVADLVPDLLWSTDPTGLTDWYNQSWLDYTGQTLEVAQSAGWLVALHPEDQRSYLRTFQIALERGEPLRQEFRIRDADGAYRWFLVQARPVRDEASETVRWYGAATDIHQEWLALAAAQMARTDAETALRTRDHFLSIASHELRTPLTSIIGYAQMLNRRAKEGKADIERMTGIIVRHGERLKMMLEQMLDLSRLQEGQFNVEYRPVDLVALVAHVVDDFRSTLPIDNRHTVVLASSLDTITMMADAQRLEQVLLNLLSNAVKYSPLGGAVNVRVLHTAAEVAIDIQDEGLGMPPDVQEHLFDPFYRGSNITPDISGFGLGLHIVQQIVQHHGGRIEITSTEGAGSTFRVILPLIAPGMDH